MPRSHGWTITTEGLFFVARKGRVERKFRTRGDLAAFLSTMG